MLEFKLFTYAIPVYYAGVQNTQHNVLEFELLKVKL